MAYQFRLKRSENKVTLRHVTKEFKLQHVGRQGLSAYQVAVLEGFVGTEAEWLESLQGAPGAPGDPATNIVKSVNGRVDHVIGLAEKSYVDSELATKLESIVAGDNVIVDNTDPLNPIITVESSSDAPSIYDLVVPDDYPTLTEALNNATDGQSIFVKPGTYVEEGGTFSTPNLTIFGAGYGSTRLTLTNGLTLSGDNVSLNNLTADVTAGVNLTLSGSYSSISGCAVEGGSTDGFFTSGYFTSVNNNRFQAVNSDGRVVISERNRVVGNHFIVPHKGDGGISLGFYSTFSGNFVYRQALNASGGPLIFAWGERCVISGNTFFCGLGAAIAVDYRCNVSSNSIFQGGGNIITAGDGCVVGDNTIGVSYFGVGVFVNGTGVDGFSAVVTDNNVASTGANPVIQLPQPGHVGIRINGSTVRTIVSNNSVAGCEIGVDILADAADNLVLGNAFTYFTTAVADLGTGTEIKHNIGADNDPEKIPENIGDGVEVYSDSTDLVDRFRTLKSDDDSVEIIQNADNIDFSVADYVAARIAALVDSSPATLDTLKEFATALGNDPNFATTVATSIGLKADDSNVVHKTGTETIGGPKTFTSNTSVIGASTTELLVANSQAGGTGYRQTFRNQVGTKLEWLWGNNNNESEYMALFLQVGKNWLDNKTRDFVFMSTARANVMTIQPGGNVGINQATPGATLDVVGSIFGTRLKVGSDGIYTDDSAGVTRIFGGAVSAGAGIVVGGPTHATIPNIGQIRVGATTFAEWSSTALLPGANLTNDLGGDTKYWLNIRGRRHYFNSTAYIDGTVPGIAALTGALTVAGSTTLNSTTNVNSSINLGATRRSVSSTTSVAPDVMGSINMNDRNFIDAIAAQSGQIDYLYCADRNPIYTISSNYSGVENLFNGDMATNISVPIAGLGATPLVITMERNDGATISASDTIQLITTGHRLSSWGGAFNTWKVETKNVDNNWTTVLDRTGVSDLVQGLSIPLHIQGGTYPDGDANYHYVKGVRLTVSAATAVSYSPGNLNFSSLQIRDSRPTATAANGLGALDKRGGSMFGDTTWKYGKVITKASEATNGAGLNIPSGVAPTSPVNGDMWQDGTNLKIRIGGVTKTVTLT